MRASAKNNRRAFLNRKPMKEPILTGKALEDFTAYISKGENIENSAAFVFNGLTDTGKFAYIQEWLDSVEIYTTSIPSMSAKGNKWMYSIFSHIQEYNYGTSGKFTYTSRTEALKAAIIKANEIYNERT